MSESPAEHIQQIFSHALAQPVSKRHEFIRKACGDDYILRTQIEILVRQSSIDSSLDAKLRAESAAAPTILEPASLKPGELIGRYKLIQQIGEGGFGIVFMAEQKEPVRRVVALKILKLGMDTRQVIARFEAERQALAMMDHPNIARVLDAGATLSGRPYFVMELVRGESVTTYCDRLNLDIDQRLAIFKQTCHAVQHAHQKGIIHRDLKPSNVMITLHDGVPIPKVIDFGIAKATSTNLTEKTVVTEFRQFIGTPEYMSPEQAEMSTADIDTRSDVYSLGVLLYELLTGTIPFDAKTLRSADQPEIQRIIREVSPPRPSTRLSTLETLSAIAADRQIDPNKLRAMIKGDLDWIVMKALEKDRTRRYDSANDLAADVQRFQDRKPVVAGPPSTNYKIRKFVSRHRVSVAVGLAMALTLTVSFGAAVIGFVQASNDRELAERETEKAAAVVAFLNDMLISVHPDQALGKPVTVRAILDEAAMRLTLGDLSGRDEVRATLMVSIGNSYSALGHNDDARQQLTAALELLTNTVGLHNPMTIDCLDSLANIYQRIGEYDRARELFEKAAAARELLQDDVKSIASTLGLASVLNSTGDYEQAEDLLRTTIDSARHDSDAVTDKAELANSLVLLGQTLELTGRYDDSIRSLNEGLEMYRQVHGSTHSSVAGTLSLLGAALEANEQYERAEHAHREALDIRHRILPEHHHALGNSLNNLGIVLYRLGRYEEAKTMLRDALANRERNFAGPHASTAATLVNLANVLLDQGHLNEAMVEFDQAILLATQALPAGHMMPAVLRGGRARCLIELEQYDEAERELIEVHASLEETLGSDHRRTQRVIEIAITLYERTNRNIDADLWRARLVDS